MKRLVLLTFTAIGALSAQPNRVSGPAGGYEIDLPDKWTFRRVDDVTLEAVSDNELGTLRIVEQGRGARSAAEILAKTEKSQGYTNLLTEKERTLGREAEKQMGAQGSAVGRYAITKEGFVIRIDTWVFIKGQRAFVVRWTVPESYASEFEETVQRTLKSLRIH